MAAKETDAAGPPEVPFRKWAAWVAGGLTALSAVCVALSRFWDAVPQAVRTSLLFALAGAGLTWVYFLWRHSRDLSKEVARAAEFSSALEQKVEDLKAKAEGRASERALLEESHARLKNNRIRAITPGEYAKIVHELIRRHGAGELLLFNVELNSFDDENLFAHFWRPLVERAELLAVRLALPPAKFRRWEGIVTGDRLDYFKEPQRGDKFIACEYREDPRFGKDHIAFALYRSQKKPDEHDFCAVFLINRPFIEARGQGTVFEYLQIIEYNGDQPAIGLCRRLWDQLYDPQYAESATLIIGYHRKLRSPPDIGAILKEHRCDSERAEEILRCVAVRRRVDVSARVPPPEQIAAADRGPRGRAKFALTYRPEPDRNGPREAVTGWLTHLPEPGARPRPCVIWASGFGDGERPTMARAISERIRGKDPELIEVFFKQSGELEDSTCTRIREDIDAVVDYVCNIPGVDKDKVCVVGISLGGYLSATLAARDPRIRSLVLVAPPFDVVGMLDRFRDHYISRYHELEGRAPTFADFLKARDQFRIVHWDKSEKYSNYFNNVVRAHYLVDFATKGRKEFGRKNFLRSLEAITKSGRKVTLVYGKDDMVVLADQNIPLLDREIKSGNIDSEFITVDEIALAHYYPGPEEAAYPLRSEKMHQMIAEMAEAIERSLAGFGGPPPDKGQRPPLRVVPPEQRDFPEERDIPEAGASR